MLALVIAPRGEGKTTVGAAIARQLGRPGMFLTPVGKTPPKNPLTHRQLPLGPIGGATAAKIMSREVRKGDCVVLDEAESFLPERFSAKSAIMLALSFGRNLGLHQVVMAKTIVGIPKFVRANVNVVLWRKPEEAADQEWFRKKALPLDDLPKYHFYARGADRKVGIFCAKS